MRRPGAGDGRAGPVAELRAQSPAFYDAFLKRRNQAWAEALAAQMARRRRPAGRRRRPPPAGDDGLPALMKARGFEVERIQ
ncbi:MAG: hypothetical protein PHG43_05080 [Phenylobacterium sp.]|nr:hypothetical protein [Phenylobacterium sp.]